MVATSGDPLLKQQAQQALTEQLFPPLAELLTPNLPEAEQLTGTSITSPPQMEHEQPDSCPKPITLPCP